MNPLLNHPSQADDLWQKIFRHLSELQEGICGNQTQAFYHSELGLLKEELILLKEEFLTAYLLKDRENKKNQEEKEATLRSLEQVSKTGNYELELQTMELQFSEGLYHLFGEKPFLFTPTLDWIDSRSHPEDVQAIKKILEQAIEYKNPYYYTRRIYRPNGDQVVLEAHGQVVCNASGKAVKLIGLVQDITARVKAQAILEQSQALLKATFDSSLDMIQVFKAIRDEHGCIIDFKWILINHTAENVFGNVLEARLIERNPGVLAAGIFSHFVQVTESGMPRQYELYYDNEQFKGWFCQSVVKLADGVATTTSDITERKQAQRELEQSRTLLQSVFNTTLIGMSVLDAIRDEEGTITDFGIRMINEELERETGRKDLAGKLYTLQYPGVRQNGIFDLMCKVVATGQAESIEYFYPYDGFNKWFSSMFVKLGDGLVTTNLDITDRKLTEEALFKQYHILKQSEDVASIGSWEYDLMSGTFCWSEGMYRLFGLPIGSPVNPKTYLDYVIEADWLIAENIIARIQGSKEPLEEILRVEVNGKVLTLKIQVIAIYDEQGNKVKMLGVALDISELKRLEQENLEMRLKQQQELLHAILDAQEEERRRISESLHNGIGQLLYATKLNLELVNLDRLLQNEEGVIKALATTQYLLTEAIKQTRRVSYELVPILLKDFGLQIAIEEFCRHFDLQAIKINCQIADFPKRMDAHLEVALYRISQELVNNIVKHAQATQASIVIGNTKGKVVLEVTDNGKGFYPDHVKEKGLGLKAIADRIKLLNGKLSILSTPGQGTCTRIYIPFK